MSDVREDTQLFNTGTTAGGEMTRLKDDRG